MKKIKFFLIVFSLLIISLFLTFFIKIYKCKNIKNNIDILKKIDAIVVLTGNKGRIAEAFRFIDYKNIKFIVISGANPRSSREDILSTYLKYKNFFKKVIIEHFSTNTVENAVEVKKIVKELRIRNFMIITSCTHIIRAKFIFKKIFLNHNGLIYFWKTKENITFEKLIKEEVKYLFDFFLLKIRHLQ